MLPKILTAGTPEGRVWALFIGGKPSRHCKMVNRAARIGVFYEGTEFIRPDGSRGFKFTVVGEGKKRHIKTYTQTLYDAELRNRETGEIVRI